jgi:hypothetical protein
MSRSIWAYVEGAFRPGNGWDDVISLRAIGNLSELLVQLETLGAVGQVARLAIVAHGDRAGVVSTDPPMNQASIFRDPNVCGPISSLRRHLAARAHVLLYSCIAGARAEGSAFLCALSSFWPGSTVVGFNTSGEISPYHFTAGDIFDTGGEFTGGTVLHGRTSAALRALRMTEKSASAKWARDGAIIRMPRRGR